MNIKKEVEFLKDSNGEQKKDRGKEIERRTESERQIYLYIIYLY